MLGNILNNPKKKLIIAKLLEKYLSQNQEFRRDALEVFELPEHGVLKVLFLPTEQVLRVWVF